jgi:hypothetical protein
MSHPIKCDIVNHPATTLSKKQIDILRSSKTSSNAVHQNGFTMLAKYCNLNYKPRALSIVDIGPHGSGQGHDEFVGDAMQCYALVLLYIATKDERYAVTAIKIQETWQTILKDFKGSNAPLEMAWGSICIVRAIELLKNIYPKWSMEIESRFNKYLDMFVLPTLKCRYNEIQKWSNNWILTIQEALLQIALFRNDVQEVTRIIKEYIGQLPRCIMTVDGSCTETNRDIIHSQFQIASAIQIAEMCWHQGVDVYSCHGDCLMKCMEFHASIINGNVPVGRKKEDFKDVWFMPSAWEVGYNHYSNRRNKLLPNTLCMLNTKNNRPEKASFNWGPSWMFFQSDIFK